jgi:4-hydroxy-tetrahydrodipicolinate synthase
MASFGSVITAMVTPMDRLLAVEYDRAAALAKRLVDSGSDGLVVCGTTGESPTLTDEEKVGLFRTVREAVGGRAKVIAGTGTYNTAHSIHLTREAERVGCDGVLLVNPYYNKPPRSLSCSTTSRAGPR